MPGKEQEPKDFQIGIVGPMGVGKSTLARLLATNYGPEVVTESFQKNPFLPKFYEDPKQYSFKSQVWFLLNKVGLLITPSPSKGGIIDPTLEMDKNYAEAQHRLGMMTDAEWNLYCFLYDTLTSSSRIPEVNVFLSVKAPAGVLRERIRNRGRVYELWMLDNFPEYLDKLIKVVTDWERTASKNHPIIDVDSQKYNFDANGPDRGDVLAMITEGINSFLKERQV